MSVTLTFTEKSVEPGGYHYEVDNHDAVTITFNPKSDIGGDEMAQDAELIGLVEARCVSAAIR